MGNNSVRFFLIIIFLTTIAQAQQISYAPANPDLNQYLNSIPIPKIPPGHPLYGFKISIENLQEAFTFNKQNRLLLKQEHLDDRLKEAQYMAVFKNSNIDIPLFEAKLKTIEIESLRSTTTFVCKSDTSTNIHNIPYCDTISHNQYVLNNLLNSPHMPEQSRMGLQNAINRSGMRQITSQPQRTQITPGNPNKPVYIAANMTQGTFGMSPNIVKLMPFRTAMVLDPRDNLWYSIIIKSDEIVISDTIVQYPDYYLYPTSAQLTTLESIAKDVNKRKSISFSDTLKLSKVWYNIEKIPVQ